jgi:hypothetical protein
LVLALGGGYFAGRASMSGSTQGAGGEAGRVKAKPGPWGELDYLPITIAAPAEMLKVRGIEEERPRWHFRGMTRNDLARLLDDAGVTGAVRERFLTPGVLAEDRNGVVLTPTCEAVERLEQPALRALYEKLALAPENASQRWEVLAKYAGTSGDYGVSTRVAQSVEALSVRHGKFLVTYGMTCVFKSIPGPEEKTGLMKSLTQQSSMLVRLNVTPETDLIALKNYWGRAMWATDVEAILESLHKLPDGGSVDLLELLPPLPTSLMHAFPVPHNQLGGPEVVKNCSWTAFNFFRDPPDSEFTNATYVVKKLETDYFPIQSDPRYGDVAVFLTPGKYMIHVAVYLADDLYFTKNGDNPWHPWVISTSADLLEAFSFGLPEGQSLTIHYFRSKYY